MVEIRSLTKRFGAITAVDDVSFAVGPGRVTGFLGPNGAGKTTTLRMLLGLAEPTAGSATIGGRPYRDLDDPLGTVGAVLERSGFHPGRSGRDHLRALARAARLPGGRADECLAQVGMTEAGGRRVGGYSLGMRQRLALAAALLGDPPLLVLDEPANGLDPQGIRWMRDFLRARAAAGGTVLVSSHVLAEMAQTVDEVAVIAGGRLRAQGPVAELVEGRGSPWTWVRTPEAQRFAGVLREAGAEVQGGDGGVDLTVRGLPVERIGELASERRVVLHGLVERQASLEDVFFELTAEAPGPTGGASPGATGGALGPEAQAPG